MNFCAVIDVFDQAGIDVRRIYWSCNDADEHPDLLIRTKDGLRHVKTVELDAAGDIIVSLDE